MDYSQQPQEAPHSPELEKGTATHAPALNTIQDAVTLVTSLENENSDRIKKNARILRKYNAERPNDPAQLAAHGLSWKQNFSTKPLTTLADKVVPRFTRALKEMRYLTASKLPDRFPNAAAKTELFRSEITKLCRARDGWDEFVWESAFEDVLFGFCAAGWTDRFTWFPKLFAQADFLVPSGTKHTSNGSQIVCFREDLLTHELFRSIQNKEAAKVVGWNLENVIKAIDCAKPDDRRSKNTDMDLVYADLQRENNILQSFVGNKTISVWHVLVAEVDGWVTHVAFDAESKQELFWKNKQFKTMADAASFFSFQHGNGKIHGSKGIGREIYTMAGVLDRARNEVVDRLQLSGKVLLQCDEAQIKRFRMSVVGAAILIANGYTVAQAKIEPAVESFMQLDEFITNLLDQIAGSTSPKAFTGDRVTKAAVELYAAREEERRDTVIERYLTHFARMMGTIQKRICDPRTSESDAKELQALLLQSMTQEELDYLANQPAVSTIADYSEQERQAIVMLATEVRGNPLYDARKLEKRRLTAQFDAEFAEDVLLPENDPTVTAEQSRMQMIESDQLTKGQELPVSPRDNHAIHLDTLRAEVTEMIEAAGDSPDIIQTLGAMLGHAAQHVEYAEQMGIGDQVAESKQWLTETQKIMQQMVAEEQAAAEQQASEDAALQAQEVDAATPMSAALAEQAATAGGTPLNAQPQ